MERWLFGKNSTAEGGSNAGSDFVLNRYNDAGTLLGTPIKILRSNGYVGIGDISPSYLLDVNGSSRIGWLLIAASGISITGGATVTSWGIAVTGASSFNGATNFGGGTTTINGANAFKYTDGNQAEGKVLMSDASGNARWANSSVPRICSTSNGAPGTCLNVLIDTIWTDYIGAGGIKYSSVRSCEWVSSPAWYGKKFLSAWETGINYNSYNSSVFISVDSSNIDNPAPIISDVLKNGNAKMSVRDYWNGIDTYIGYKYGKDVWKCVSAINLTAVGLATYNLPSPYYSRWIQRYISGGSILNNWVGNNTSDIQWYQLDITNPTKYYVVN